MLSEHPIAALRKKLQSGGLLEKTPFKCWSKVVILLLIVGVLFFAHITLPLGWSIAMLVVTGLFSTTLAMTGHEGIHSSACNSRAGNLSLSTIVFPLFCGMSMEYWREKHNVKHHSFPNVVDKDPDIHGWPIAFSSVDYERSGAILKFFQKHLQGYYFWPITLLAAHSMRIEGIRFLAKHPFNASKKTRFNRVWLLDCSMIVLHFFLWLVVPILAGITWWMVLGFYGILWAFVGLFLSMIFIVGHAAQPIIYEADENWRLQIETGRRIKMGPIGRFFFVGLDYQIEHHLFPSASHFSLPKIAPSVKKYAEENGWNYQEIGLFKALWISTVYLNKAWKIAPLEKLTAKPVGQ
ncbi:MAG TPA: acyl-CoA desaturase [Candidatus Poseidoniales archaeon]|nr:acyl-CoA desaturase [Candidatus Poseidoniales archaeon]